MTGSAVQWLRDQLGIISGAAQSESLARQVEDNGGVYFVPAFSGLFAPYWRSDARGAIVGLSRYNTNAHVARATLEAICYQSRDVVEAMEQDSGVRLDVLRVDGGVTANELCMQIQADVLGVPVSRPVVAETTALGAAYAAGLAVGFWKNTDELVEQLERGQALAADLGRAAAREGLRGTGRRPSSARSTGSTSGLSDPGQVQNPDTPCNGRGHGATTHSARVTAWRRWRTGRGRVRRPGHRRRRGRRGRRAGRRLPRPVRRHWSRPATGPPEPRAAPAS